MVSDDAPEFVLVVVVVADLEESVPIRLRDNDSATDGLVKQQDGVSGRYGAIWLQSRTWNLITSK